MKRPARTIRNGGGIEKTRLLGEWEACRRGARDPELRSVCRRRAVRKSIRRTRRRIWG